jgi:thiol-disulfide isomerase/thioredoxin
LESTPFEILVLLRRDQEMRYKAIPILIFLLFSPTLLTSVHAQPQIGKKTPGFITTTLDGKRIVLKDYWEQKGKKVLVLSFFATWCQPCKEDLKYLQKIQITKPHFLLKRGMGLVLHKVEIEK